MYYEVLVTSHRYVGREALTYHSATEVPLGSVVTVKLRNATTTGIVIDKVAKPTFRTSPLGKVLVATPLPSTSLEFLKWLQGYYPAPLGPLTSQFMPPLLSKTENKSVSHQTEERNTGVLPELTPEQEVAVQKINTHTDQRTWWLHGETGSGKTRIYQELLQKTLSRGQSALILTPEIGLTSQLAQDIQQAAKNYSVFLWHSGLTDKERRQAWLSILESTQPVVVVGARSALFTPFQKLGLIVVDEAHDQAYKQEQAPYYQTLRAAGRLAQIHQALLLFGSATPPVSEYYWAKQKKVPVLRLTKPALAQSKDQSTTTEVINLTDRSNFSRDAHLSNQLLSAIEVALRNGEQSLVFLNRRGTARLVLCQNCAWQALCPHCDLPLTYHDDNHLLRCHTCGFRQPAPLSCPVCQSTDIIYRSVGTKTLANKLSRLFPNAHVQRFDTDNLKGERLESHFPAIQAGNIDILVGTQLLVKGLDLPNLSVVGIVAADSSLSFPDYTAEEQTYQLLTQVMGRVGRGHRAGHIVLQTYNPQSQSIQAALHKDWESFYRQQLTERQAFAFPPFRFLLKLTCRRKTQSSAQKTAHSLMGQLAKSNLPIELIGPSPSFIEKAQGYYRWQIIVKARDRQSLITVIKLLPAGWTHDLDPSNLL